MPSSPIGPLDRSAHPGGGVPTDAGSASASDGDELTRVLVKFRRTLARQLRDQLPADAAAQPEDAVRRQLIDSLEALLNEHGALLDEADQQIVVRMVLDDLFEYGPLSELMRDTNASDILVNGPYQIFLERMGQLQATDVTFDDEAHLVRIMQRMIRHGGRRLDTDNPLVDTRLPDGSRMNAILNPPAINGPLLSIRRFGARPLTADDLLKNGTLTPEILAFLSACVRSRLNIVIVGGTGSGKTTLLNALSRYIGSHERIATIEDTAELELQQTHVVKLESRPADAEGPREISMRELVKNTLRIRPDRIIVGECRGPEALEMLQAMNTGHEGSMSTIHANSPREALSRMELMISLGGVEVPALSLRKQMAASINLIIQIGRQVGGQRRIVSVSEITGMEGETVSMHEIFKYVQTGIEDDNVIGYFVATGIRPVCLNRLLISGAELSPQMFSQRRLELRSKQGGASRDRNS